MVVVVVVVVAAGRHLRTISTAQTKYDDYLAAWHNVFALPVPLPTISSFFCLCASVFGRLSLSVRRTDGLAGSGRCLPRSRPLVDDMYSVIIPRALFLH